MCTRYPHHLENSIRSYLDEKTEKIAKLWYYYNFDQISDAVFDLN